MAKATKTDKETTKVSTVPETTPVEDGFGNGLIDPATEDVTSSESAKELTSLNQESDQINRIKVREQSTILSPVEFEQNRSKAQSQVMQVQSANGFNFKAGVDPVTGRRFFNVKGFADKNHLYRTAKMTKDGVEYYFLGSAYDAIFGATDKKTLSFLAWIEVKKGKSVTWQQTPVSQNELVGVVTLATEDGRKIFESIKAQGGNPTL